MSPKEKAKELTDKYFSWYGNEEYFSYEFAKECASIAVDEILWEIIKYADNSKEYVVENSKYWQEVKNEIELL